MTAPKPTKLDQTQILQGSFDEDTGRLRVDAAVSATIGTLSVEIDAADGDNIAISDGVNTLTVNPDGTINVNTAIDQATDSIKVGDGTDLLAINTDGSINVKTQIINGLVKNKYGEVSSVGSSVDTLIVTHTMIANGDLLRIAVSGGNIATYEVKVNGITQDKARTYFSGAMNTEFMFDVGSGIGLTLNSGDVIQVRVIHTRPDPTDFNARIQYRES
jgi:hypothetical protein